MPGSQHTRACRTQRNSTHARGSLCAKAAASAPCAPTCERVHQAMINGDLWHVLRQLGWRYWAAFELWIVNPCSSRCHSRQTHNAETAALLQARRGLCGIALAPAQHGTARHSTAQHSTAQRSTHLEHAGGHRHPLRVVLARALARHRPQLELLMAIKGPSRVGSGCNL